MSERKERRERLCIEARLVCTSNCPKFGYLVARDLSSAGPLRSGAKYRTGVSPEFIEKIIMSEA
jgi:hypothetical protein